MCLQAGVCPVDYETFIFMGEKARINRPGNKAENKLSAYRVQEKASKFWKFSGGDAPVRGGLTPSDTLPRQRLRLVGFADSFEIPL